MLSDFELITHKFPDRQDITIYPISDVHLGAAEHKEREWNKFCDSVLQEPNAYLVLGGDLINNATRSSVSDIFSEKYRPSTQKKMMREMLEPLKGRIICSVMGNHERRSVKDVDDSPSYDIMAKLDLEHLYRENIAFVKLQFGNTKAKGLENPTYVLAVTHGSGGGIYTGSSVNRNERFGYVLDGVDLVIVGHTHKPFVTNPFKIKVDPFNNKVALKPFKVVTSSSWLDYGGYAAQKMLLPSSYVPQSIKIYGKKKQIEVTM